jgi:hypothetical protein
MAPYSKRFVGTATKYELHPFSRLISAQASRKKGRRNDKKHPSQNRRAVNKIQMNDNTNATTRKDANKQDEPSSGRLILFASLSPTGNVYFL